MSRIKRSKSGTFLMELLFNLFLFCLLCSCGLLFFSKSHNMTKDTTALHQAVSLASSVAGVYESGDGSLDIIKEFYPCKEISAQTVTMYLDETFSTCPEAEASYYLTMDVLQSGHRNNEARIRIYKANGAFLYDLSTYHHTQITVEQIKEAQHDN